MSKKLPILVYSLLLPLTTAYTLLALFQNFSIWEDSSFCIYAINHYLNTGSMTDIGFPYGPVYFWLYRVASFLSGTFTEASIRLWASFTWSCSCLLLGLIAHKICRNLWIGVAVYLASLHALSRIVVEPGLANSVIFLLTTLCLSAWILPKRAQYFSCGLLAATICFVKINLGLYLFLSLSLLTVFAQKKLPLSLLWSGPVILGPIFLMRNRVDWPLLLALTLANLDCLKRIKEFELEHHKHGLGQLFAGFFSASLLALFGSWLEGFDPKTLFHRMLGQHLDAGTDFYVSTEAALGVKVLCLMVFLFALRAFSQRAPSWSALAFPFLALLGTVTLDAPTGQFFPTESYAYYLIPIFPLVWLLKITDDRHLLLLTVACFQPLGAFPVAGSQRDIGVIYFFTLAFCVLGQWTDRPQGRRAAPLLALFLGLFLSYQTFLLNKSYQSKTASTYPTISPKLRLLEPQWFIREWVLYSVKENGGPVLTLPGLFSFPNWTGLESAQTEIVSAFPYSLNSKELEQSFLHTREFSPPTIVLQPGCLAFWNRGGVAAPEMKQYLNETVPIASRFDFHVLATKESLPKYSLVGLWIHSQDEEKTVLRVKLPKNAPNHAKMVLSEILGSEVIPTTQNGEFIIVPSPAYREKSLLRVYDENDKLLYRFPVLELSEPYRQILRKRDEASGRDS